MSAAAKFPANQASPAAETRSPHRLRGVSRRNTRPQRTRLQPTARSGTHQRAPAPRYAVHYADPPTTPAAATRATFVHGTRRRAVMAVARHAAWCNRDKRTTKKEWG